MWCNVYGVEEFVGRVPLELLGTDEQRTVEVDVGLEVNFVERRVVVVVVVVVRGGGQLVVAVVAQLPAIEIDHELTVGVEHGAS